MVIDSAIAFTFNWGPYPRFAYLDRQNFKTIA